jgi:ATP-dependent DNA helicase DinG
MQNAGMLPSYNMVVFDEAHTVSQVASDHVGISITQYQVEYNLYRLYNEHVQKGLLVTGKMNANIEKNFTSDNNIKNGSIGNNREEMMSELREVVVDCLHRSTLFFGDLADWFYEHSGGNGRVREVGIVGNVLSEGLVKLVEKLRRLIEVLENVNERQELRAVRDKIMSINDDINLWLTQSLQEESVYWVELKTTSRGKRRASINAVPIDIGPILRKHLFGQIQSVIMTSATLTTE